MARTDRQDSIPASRWAARNLAAALAVLVAAAPLMARVGPGVSATAAASLLLAGVVAALPFAYLALQLTRHEVIDGNTVAVAQGALFAGRIAAFCMLGICVAPLLVAVAMMIGGMLLAAPALGAAILFKDSNVAMLALSGVSLLALLRPLGRALREIEVRGGSRVQPRAGLRIVGPLAFAGGVAVVKLLVGGSSAHAKLPAAFVAQQSYDEAMRSASGALAEIERCAQLYSWSHAGTFPDSLPDLWASDPRCHGTKIETARSGGIDIRYRAAPRIDGTAPSTFEAAARLDSVRDPSRSGLLTSESGIVFPLAGRRSPSDSSFWPDSATPLFPLERFAGPASVAAACADRVNWDVTTGGYPLDPMRVNRSSIADHCGFGYGGSPIIVGFKVYDLRYVALDTAGATSRAFAVTARPRGYGVDGFRSYRFSYRDHSVEGAHATPANRAADDHDPPPQPCEIDSLVPCRLHP